MSVGWSNRQSIPQNDKVLLQGYDRFLKIDFIILKYTNIHGNNVTTIINSFQPNARNAAYCYFNLIADNDNKRYRIIIDINNKLYYCQQG